ncbi:hypothetical protein [Bartonella mastomydis]|uniref:hypothetical protein n=1 Tax=Bartonella mastomydis TaxID=1820002 RepID=UPI0011173A4E|nr:hypothetical protein [Bartonella mastomydis]
MRGASFGGGHSVEWGDWEEHLVKGARWEGERGVGGTRGWKGGGAREREKNFFGGGASFRVMRKTRLS